METLLSTHSSILVQTITISPPNSASLSITGCGCIMILFPFVPLHLLSFICRSLTLTALTLLCLCFVSPLSITVCECIMIILPFVLHLLSFICRSLTLPALTLLCLCFVHTLVSILSITVGECITFAIPHVSSPFHIGHSSCMCYSVFKQILTISFCFLLLLSCYF